MTTFSCAIDRKNIGESTCTKGVLDNPSQMMLVDDNFTFKSADVNNVTFWETAIKAKQVVLFPLIFNFEAANIDVAYEETAFGASKNSQGKYGFRLFYKRNIEIHKNIFSFDGSTDRIILFDDNGKLMSTLVGGVQSPTSDNTYTGMTPQLFSPENQTLDENSTKSPVRILFEDATEWNVNGFIFIQTVLSQLKSLTTVDLAVVGTPIATEIQISVTNANDGAPNRGLILADFTYTGGTLTGLAENAPGVYDLAGTGLTSGNMDLVTAPNSSQFVESSGLVAVTI